MKIRFMGREEELDLARSYYKNLQKENYIKSVVVSSYYPVRGSNNMYRLYVDIDYYDSYLLNNPINGGLPL